MSVAQTILAIGGSCLLYSIGEALVAWAKKPRHQHEWETEAKSDIRRVGTNQIVGEVHTLRCKHCGDKKAYRQ